MPDNCANSEWGCCEDGITHANGMNHAGCPEACRCHKLGKNFTIKML